MYTISTFLDRTMMVSSVAPPVDRKLSETVRELTVAHLLIAGGRSFEPFAAALETLDDEQIDRGRLQWLHTIKEIRDTLDHHRREASINGHEPHRMTLSRIVGTMADVVVKDVEQLAQRCDKSPRNAVALAQWPQALAVLAQAVVLSRTMVRLDPKDAAWSALTVRLGPAFSTGVARCTTFRDGVGATYGSTRDALAGVAHDVLLDAAHTALAAQAAQPMDLSYARLTSLQDRMGSRDQLWTLVQKESLRQAAIDKGDHVPLTASAAQTVRDGMVGLLRGFDAYRDSGFLSALRAIGQEQAYCGATTQVYVDGHQDAADLRASHRRACANPYRREKPSDQELQDALAQLPAQRRDGRLEATARLDVAARIQQLARRLALALDASVVTDAASIAPEGITLTLTAQDDSITVGRWNDDPSRVLLVYPDASVGREEAMYAMVVPSSLLDDGVPEFSSDLKQRSCEQGWTGTNFPSVASFMREMEQEPVQTWLVGRPFTVVHSNPARPSRTTYAAPHRAGL